MAVPSQASAGQRRVLLGTASLGQAGAAHAIEDP